VPGLGLAGAGDGTNESMYQPDTSVRRRPRWPAAAGLVLAAVAAVGVVYGVGDHHARRARFGQTVRVAEPVAGATTAPIVRPVGISRSGRTPTASHPSSRASAGALHPARAAAAGEAPPATALPGYGCAAALAWLRAHAAPGFSLECPGYAQGHQAMTCENVAAVCPGQSLIVIADPCPAAYENEASNSWVLSGRREGPLDPYGYCH
jgi:hypothetical protein